MPVKFRGVSIRPAPLVEYNKSAIYDKNKDVIGYTYNFTLTGHILSLGTDVDSTGVASGVDMDGVLNGQSFIRERFNQPGLLEIESTTTSTNEIKAWATPENISFSNGIWVNRTDYSVTLVADEVDGDARASGLSETSERWSFSENQDGTENVTHDISARGIYRLDPDGNPIQTIESVDSWVESRKITGPTVTTPDGEKTVYNLLVSKNIDEDELSVSLTENFLHSSGTWTYSESKTEQTTYDPTYASSVSYNLSVQGLEENGGDSSYTNALAGYAALEATYVENSPYILSTEVISRDMTQGRIDLTRTYSNNKITNLIPGALEEAIEISIQDRSDLVAQINIPGKADGPLFQDLNMQSAIQKTVNITGRMAGAGSGLTIELLGSAPDTDAMMDVLGSGYVVSDTETWNPITGQFTRSKTWTY